MYKMKVSLNLVMDSMCSTVQHEMSRAAMTYQDKPREQRVFDYPVQVNRLSGMNI